VTRQTSIKENLNLRAGIIQAIRRFFIENGYLEVETPLRIPAPAPEAFIDAQDSGKWFLQTSPELCMKRLLSAGYSRIFQICKCFRAKERGSKHLPEFTILEWYSANNTYVDLMEQCEDLVRFVAAKIGFEDLIVFQGNNVYLKKPWDRITVFEAFEEYACVSLEKALLEDSFDEIMACEIEPNLGMKKPVFLYDYPASKSALARLKKGDNSLAQRCELYMAGLELSNGFTELTDPLEQRKRFEQELSNRRSEGSIVYPMPEKFLTDLKAMPDAAGIAFGIDRLIMLFADSPLIDNVIAFTPEDL
jgi:lysyl-tRNA synthetase class 2